jgi:hypothetical protein
VSRVAALVEMLPSPIAKLIGAGLEVTVEAVKAADRAPDVSPLKILNSLRDQLRESVTAAWQSAINESDPKDA